MRLQDKLRNLRLQRQLTQIDLAKALNTSQSAITAWERGTRIPERSTIAKIAKFYGVPVSYLLMDENTSTDAYVQLAAERIAKDSRFRILFDRLNSFSDSDLDAVLSVVTAISKARNNDE